MNPSKFFELFGLCKQIKNLMDKEQIYVDLQINGNEFKFVQDDQFRTYTNHNAFDFYIYLNNARVDERNFIKYSYA